MDFGEDIFVIARRVVDGREVIVDNLKEDSSTMQVAGERCDLAKVTRKVYQRHGDR